MITYKGILWRYYQHALIPDTPPHIEINININEAKELLKISGAYLLRWTNEWDRGNGEFWYVIKDEKEDMKNFSSNMRNQIRKALKNCNVEIVAKDFISKKGYDVYINAFKRYNTFIKPLNKEQFQKSIINSKNKEFWGVFYRGELITYAENLIQGRVCNYSVVKIHPDYLKFYPSYALFHEMNKYYLNEKNFLYVSDGARSISHQTNIQNFLIQKFKFRKAYCKLNIVYRKDLKIIIELLYPLRNFSKKFNNTFFQKINILLKQEEIRRSFD